MVDRITIAYVITDLNTGGVPLHLLRLATAMRDRGLDVHIVSLATVGEVGVTMRERGLPVYSCGAGGPWDARVVWRLRRHLRAIQPDIVHSFLFHANLASRLAVRLAGVSGARLICEIQTVETERLWHLRVCGWTHRMGRLMVGNSQSVVDHLHAEAGVGRDRLVCVPGGVDVERFASSAAVDRASFGLRDDVPLLLWVGRLDPIKGLDELISAVARVRERMVVQLALVGAGAYEGRVREMIAEAGLADCVLLLGRRDDVAGLLKAADVFVFPSRAEGMPNALLEAMAAGVAVVTTDGPGCRDVVVDGETGLVVRVGDVAGLAGAIGELASDRERAAALGAAGLRYVRAHCTLGQCMDRYGELYGEVLGADGA